MTSITCYSLYMKNKRITEKDFYILSDFEKEKIIGSVVTIAFNELKSGNSVTVSDRAAYLKSNCTNSLVKIILRENAQWKRTVYNARLERIDLIRKVRNAVP